MSITAVNSMATISSHNIACTATQSSLSDWSVTQTQDLEHDRLRSAC